MKLRIEKEIETIEKTIVTHSQLGYACSNIAAAAERNTRLARELLEKVIELHLGNGNDYAADLFRDKLKEFDDINYTN